jgi:TolA-binding protein
MRFVKPGPKPGHGGRPRREDSLQDVIRIDKDLKDMLLAERIGNERYNDTIRRLLTEKKDKIAQLHERVDQLTQIVNEQAQRIMELGAQLLQYQPGGVMT